MSFEALIPTFLGAFGLYAAYRIFGMVLKYPAGSGKVVEIGDAIHKGAMVFMHREYKVLGIFIAVVLVAILLSPLGWNTAFAFLVGALCSGSAGYSTLFPKSSS